MGTPVKVPQEPQILSLTSESNGKKRLDFLKFGVPAVLSGRSVEWNFWINYEN